MFGITKTDTNGKKMNLKKEIMPYGLYNHANLVRRIIPIHEALKFIEDYDDDALREMKLE